MKTLEKVILYAIAAIVAIVVGFVGYNLLQHKPLGSAMYDWNWIQGGTHYTTSTATVEPIRVLAADGNRQYAIFTNRSDTALYLYISTSSLCSTYSTSTGNSSLFSCNTSSTSGYTNWLAASTTITSLNGIYLAANGGTYEMLPNKMPLGEVWVTSTASSKAINVYYK